jgi:hypothetical protein
VFTPRARDRAASAAAVPDAAEAATDSPALARDAAPQRFGRFQLLRRIAVGGMAEIWLAHDESPRAFGTTRQVVVKRILQHYAENPEFVAFFVNEGSITTRLQHENIVATHELGQIDGQYYLTMEYVRGETLLAALRRAAERKRVLPIGFAVDVVRGAAAGLAHAHGALDQAGRPLEVVHRDVSPHNLLLGFDGQVKLLDFGVAKAATQLHHTKTGTIKGKLAYLAPEQLGAAEVDARADLFALGIVLHETIAGRPLFKAATEAQTLTRVMHANIPPLCELRPDCPPALEQIARRALQRDPEVRYQSAAEMLTDLTAVRAQLDCSHDVVRTWMVELFADEAARPDPSPSGEWRGEVLRRPRAHVRGWTSLCMGLLALAAIGLVTRSGQPIPPDPRPTAPVALAQPKAALAAPALPAPVLEVPAPVAEEEHPAPPPRHHHSGAHASVVAGAPGKLRVVALPWADLVVDGHASGMTPAPPLTLPPGTHVVVLKNPELHKQVERRVVVPAGGEAVLRVDLFR